MSEEEFNTLLEHLVRKIDTLRAGSMADDAKAQAIAQVELEIVHLKARWGKPRHIEGEAKITVPIPGVAGG